MPYLLVLFIAMPIVEIAMFIQVGGQIGLFATLAIVILTAVIGTAMLQRQGRATLTRARERLSSGEMPAQEMLEGVLLLIGGVLLLTPGFVTDAFGFACLIPVSRRWLAARLASRSGGVVVGVAGAGVEGRVFGRRRRSPEAGSGAGGGSYGTNEQASAPGSGQADRAAAGRHRAGSSAKSATGQAGSRNGDVIEGDFRRVD